LTITIYTNLKDLKAVEYNPITIKENSWL